MKYTVFASALIATAFTLAAAGKSGYSYSYSTRGRSSRKSSECPSSSSSSSSSSSCSSSSSSDSSSSSSDEECVTHFKVVPKYSRWCDFAKACHKHKMVPAKITSRNIYSAVRAIRKSKHRSAWIKSWNTDPYKGSLVLTVPNRKCDGPGSITVACKGIKKVALCMRKEDDKGECRKKQHKKKKHHKKHNKKSHKKSRRSRKSCTSSSSSECPSSSSSSSSSSTECSKKSSTSDSSSCPVSNYIRRPATKNTSSKK